MGRLHTLLWRAWAGYLAMALPAVAQQIPADTGAAELQFEQTKLLKTVVREAFCQVHDGWSSDEVLLRDDLNQRFLAACRRRMPDATATELNWTLLNLRKANGLNSRVTKRQAHRHDAYRYAAEIAARLVTDRHATSTDRMLCDERWRAEFDEAARQMAPETTSYRLRKAAFGLRKARKLRPELVVRILASDRDISTASVAELRAGVKTPPERPGIYIFRDGTGYLYVGEAVNLKVRIERHLANSDRANLADYLRRRVGSDPLIVELHAFPPDSPARQTRIRRAYESELIASRKPRFNSRP